MLEILKIRPNMDSLSNIHLVSKEDILRKRAEESPLHKELYKYLFRPSPSEDSSENGVEDHAKNQSSS